MTRPNDIDEETWNEADTVYSKLQVGNSFSAYREAVENVSQIARAIKAAREKAFEEAVRILEAEASMSTGDYLVPEVLQDCVEKILALIHPQS